MQIVCEKCKKPFTPKFLPFTFRDRAQCAHCGHLIQFNNVRKIKTFNTVLTFDLTIVTVVFCVWLIQTYNVPRLMVAFGVVVVFLLVFIPLHNLVVAHYYKKYGGQDETVK